MKITMDFSEHKRLSGIVLCLCLGTVWLYAQTAGTAHVDPASLRQRIITTAKQYLGVPYVYGAMSPSAFDCSGFVRYVYQQAANLTVPRSSRDYISAGSRITLHSAQPGDILVYDTVGGRPSHVAIYLGNDQFIHAASAGTKTGVIISQLQERYWGPKLIDVRQLVPVQTATAAQAAPAPAAPVSPPPAVPPSQPAPVPPLTPPPPPPPVAQAPAERVIAEIGFDIPASRSTYNDPIPTQKGTELAFTVTNKTGRDGRFVVIFYRLDSRMNAQEIHQELVELKKDAVHSIPPFRFGEAGRYRLIVKDNWNTQLMERSFTVRD